MLNFTIKKKGITVISIPIGKILGNTLALVMAYQIWGWKGCLFTLGLVLGSK